MNLKKKFTGILKERNALENIGVKIRSQAFGGMANREDKGGLSGRVLASVTHVEPYRVTYYKFLTTAVTPYLGCAW